MKKIVNLKDLVGKHLDAYHDGKISPSRHARVVVLDVVPLAELSPPYRKKWFDVIKEDMEEIADGCIYWQTEDGSTVKNEWDWGTKEFVFAEIIGSDEARKDPLMFARMSTGQLYAVNDWNYELDPTGDFRRKKMKDWKACAKENGYRLVYNRKTETYDFKDIEK